MFRLMGGCLEGVMIPVGWFLDGGKVCKPIFLNSSLRTSRLVLKRHSFEAQNLNIRISTTVITNVPRTPPTANGWHFPSWMLGPGTTLGCYQILLLSLLCYWCIWIDLSWWLLSQKSLFRNSHLNFLASHFIVCSHHGSDWEGLAPFCSLAVCSLWSFQHSMAWFFLCSGVWY